MPHDVIGCEIGHEFVAFVIAFPPVETEGKRTGVGEIARALLVIRAFGG